MIDAIASFTEAVNGSTWKSLAVLAVGIAMLLFGGHWLVQGAVVIARRMGVSILVIGLTVVAFGTSAPELAFNVIAATSGKGELCFGNIVGSNIANIGLVVGICALIAPLAVHSRVLGKELPWLVAISFGCILLALAPPYVLNGDEPSWGFARLHGVILLGGFALFSLSWYRMGRADAKDPLAKDSVEEATKQTQGSIAAASASFIFGLALLLLGGKFSEVGAVGLAEAAGLSDALIGLTIVAVATSLPEVCTSIIACRKGHTDLAIGNVVGSNLFNLLLVLGVTSLVSPVPLPQEEVVGTIRRGWLDLGFMCGMTLVLVPLAVSHRRIVRREGALLLALYLAYLAFVVVVELA